MASIAVALPLVRSDIDGFRMHKNIRDTAKQNFKMLLLTNPGERVMDPLYGVGLKRYLFNNFTQITFSEIETKIKEQVMIYMPALEITEIQFTGSDFDSNSLAVRISYYLPSIANTDLLEFTI
jgi:phage baseplate assembly protein W